MPILAPPVFGDLVQNLNLIVCGLQIVLRTFLNLDRDVAIVLEVLG